MKKRNWLSVTLHLVVFCIAVFGLLAVIGCSGGSDDGDAGDGSVPSSVSGTGTLRDPYIAETERTYNVEVPGWQGLCGSCDFTCPDFDKEYVSVKVSVPTAGTYKLSITGVEQNRDPVVFVWIAESSGSTKIDYVATLDNEGMGGSEEITRELEATDYYLYLYSTGGLDTVQILLAKQGDSILGARFTDMGNGTVKDNTTGLIWIKNANCFGTIIYYDGIDAAKALQNGDCGLTDGSIAGDWHLANTEELQGIGTNPPITWEDAYPPTTWTKPGVPFLNVGTKYWSSRDGNHSEMSGYRYGVAMDSGNTWWDDISEDYNYVWPVRSGN